MHRILAAVIAFILLAFGLGIYYSSRHSLSTGSCLECHAQVENSDRLSAKAHGKTQLIFYHSTHAFNQLKLKCIDCHTQDPHTGHRPREADCLGCHTGNGTAPSNACEVCHANTDRLNF